MKKIFWFFFAFVLTVGLCKVGLNTWRTTKYFQENGREATLKVGKRYNASRWSAPLPLKKIHSYTAVMQPDHEVLIESDQDLEENKEYYIRFLLRDLADAGRKMSMRPLVSEIRLKSEADGTPVKLADTDIFDKAVKKAMGPMGKDYYERPAPVAEAAPDHHKPTVPYLIAGAEDPTWEVIWNNSTLGEWIVLIVWVLAIKVLVLSAWTTPFNPNRKAGSERKNFVHPSMRRIDADVAAPSAKITYAPKPDQPDFAPPPLKPRTTVPAPASTTDTPAPAVDVSSSTTAPPFVAPDDAAGPSLKLKRKPKE